MTRAGRAFLGALLGALVVLVLHPSSRPYFFDGFWNDEAATFLDQTEDLPENLATLPAPDSETTAALWLMVGADKALTGQLSPDDASQLAELALDFARQNRNNAFWPQMATGFLWEAGDKEHSLDVWTMAARRHRWNDHQTERLSAVREGLSQRAHATQAWHYAFSYGRRTDITGNFIRNTGRTLLEHAKNQPDRMRELRLATVVNGQSLREEGRLGRNSQHGADLIQIATLARSEGSNLPDLVASPRQTLLARNELVNEFETLGREIDVELLLDAYFTDDAFEAFVNLERAQANSQRLTVLAVLASSLPGTLLFCGLVGVVIYGLGWMLVRYPKTHALLKTPWVTLISIVAGSFTFVLTGHVFPAICVTVCFGVFSVRPERAKHTRPRNLGATFAVITGFLAGLLLLALGAVFVSYSNAGQFLIDEFRIAETLSLDRPALWALVLIFLSLAFGLANGWSWARLYVPEQTTAVSLQRVGGWLAFLGLTLSVLATPVSVYADAQTGEELRKIFENETTYYLMQ